MTYPTRRARLVAEKQARRTRRRRSLTVGVAGLATVAGATIAGVAPASAADGGVAATDYSAQQGYGWSASTSSAAGNSSAAASSAGASAASSEATYQLASYTTSSAGGWQADAARWAAGKAADSSVYYSFGGNGPNGFDCSSFTQKAFAQAGKSIPRTSSAQFAGGQRVSLSNVRVGDLVFWSNNGSGSGVYHVAIYIGNGKIAHARNPQMGVSVTDLRYSPTNMLGTAVRY